mmetsp:Transcript_14390/g.30210  ORF Transcript_14390/g.30210 Transcript_14390/m.30210 type:complete len:234 (+) Transcript_14390:301-1002(+)
MHMTVRYRCCCCYYYSDSLHCFRLLASDVWVSRSPTSPRRKSQPEAYDGQLPLPPRRQGALRQTFHFGRLASSMPRAYGRVAHPPRRRQQHSPHRETRLPTPPNHEPPSRPSKTEPLHTPPYRKRTRFPWKHGSGAPVPPAPPREWSQRHLRWIPRAERRRWAWPPNRLRCREFLRRFRHRPCGTCRGRRTCRRVGRSVWFVGASRSRRKRRRRGWRCWRVRWSGGRFVFRWG